jgi:transposase-like protein
MPTDPNPTLPPPPASGSLPPEIAEALASGLEAFSLRELLGLVLNSLSPAERQAYRAAAPTDKGNGSYPRSLKRGSIPLQIELPRTRAGAFRPRRLPPPSQRDDPHETQALLLNQLASCRSVNAAQSARRKLGWAA